MISYFATNTTLTPTANYPPRPPRRNSVFFLLLLLPICKKFPHFPHFPPNPFTQWQTKESGGRSVSSPPPCVMVPHPSPLRARCLPLGRPRATTATSPATWPGTAPSPRGQAPAPPPKVCSLPLVQFSEGFPGEGSRSCAKDFVYKCETPRRVPSHQGLLQAAQTQQFRLRCPLSTDGQGFCFIKGVFPPRYFIFPGILFCQKSWGDSKQYSIFIFLFHIFLKSRRGSVILKTDPPFFFKTTRGVFFYFGIGEQCHRRLWGGESLGTGAAAEA